MGKEYFINEKTFASCTNGVLPGKMQIADADRRVSNKVFKMTNTDDRFTPFSCKYAILLLALAAVFIATLSFVGALLLGLIIGMGICMVATYWQKWENFHPKVFVQGKNALTNKSSIKCPVGGVITPTFSPLTAVLKAGINMTTTLVEAALLYTGGKAGVKAFTTYGWKLGLGYTAANYAIAFATDKTITASLTEIITNDKDEKDIAALVKDQAGYPADGNSKEFDDLKNANRNIDMEQGARANDAGDNAYRNTSGQPEGDRAYNQEMQRQGTQINANKRQARIEYRDLYERMARNDGLTGRAAEKQAARQANQAARRDANLRKVQARQDAAQKRTQAIADAKNNARNNARNNVLNDRAARGKMASNYNTRILMNFLKSWGLGIGIGVANNVFSNKANKAVDSRTPGWEKEIIKKLGLNAVAVKK